MEDNELEVLMKAAFEDPEATESFYAAFLSAEVFVLTDNQQAPTTEGRQTLEEGTEVSLIHFEMEDGTPFVPVFTSLRELQASIEDDLTYIGMDGWNLLSLIRTADAVINPAGEYGWHLRPEDIEDVLEHFSPESLTVEEDTPVLVGHPDVDPRELKDALSAVFARDERVLYAGLCLMVNEQSGERSFIVGVMFDPGREGSEIFRVAGPAGGKFLPQGHMLDFFVINGDDEDGIGQVLAQEEFGFYRRALQG